MEENTIRNQQKTYCNKKYRRRRRNRGVAIAEKYANEKWVKRQKSTFSGFVYYYLGRIRDQIFLFFHPSEFYDYKRKKIELENKEAFKKDLSLMDENERKFWEFEYGQRYDVYSPEALGQGCEDGCSAQLSVGCIYFYAFIIIVFAILFAAAHW